MECLCLDTHEGLFTELRIRNLLGLFFPFSQATMDIRTDAENNFCCHRPQERQIVHQMTLLYFDRLLLWKQLRKESRQSLQAGSNLRKIHTIALHNTRYFLTQAPCCSRHRNCLDPLFLFMLPLAKHNSVQDTRSLKEAPHQDRRDMIKRNEQSLELH